MFKMFFRQGQWQISPAGFLLPENLGAFLCGFQLVLGKLGFPSLYPLSHLQKNLRTDSNEAPGQFCLKFKRKTLGQASCKSQKLKNE